jgi:hypothetical protein
MNRNLKILIVLVAGILLLGFSGVAAHAGGKVDISFEDATFPTTPNINNPYWSLIPETTFKYQSMSKDGCEVNYVWVKNETLEIAGVITQVVQDWVYDDENCNGVVDDDDSLSENTLDWYAQDNEGNVWYLGEYTEEYLCTPHNAEGCTSTEGSWNADEEGAEPGIVMLANPKPGAFYKQEYLEDVAEDMAKVLRLNARVNLTFNNEIDPDKYKGCLMTKEWSPLERGAIEHKYYCPTEEFGGLLPLINELQGGTVRTELVQILENSGPPSEATPPNLIPQFP